MAKPMNLIALCVITLGAAELRDKDGKVTRESTLRDVLPGEPLSIDSDEGLKLLAQGAARLPLVEGDAVADGKPARAAKVPKGKGKGDGDAGGDASSAGEGGEGGGTDSGDAGDGEATGTEGAGATGTNAGTGLA